MRHDASDRELLRLVEHWTGHRKPTTKARKSMKISLLIIAIIGAVFALQSCAGIYSGVTGHASPTTPVQRADGTGKAFDVATTDVLRAESQPVTAWGLYNAGAVAARTAEVADSGK